MGWILSCREVIWGVYLIVFCGGYDADLLGICMMPLVLEILLICREFARLSVALGLIPLICWHCVWYVLFRCGSGRKHCVLICSYAIMC